MDGNGSENLTERLKRLRNDTKGIPSSNNYVCENRRYGHDYWELLDMYVETQDDTREEYEACLKRHVTRGHYSQEKADEYLMKADEAHREIRPWKITGGHGE